MSGVLLKTGGEKTNGRHPVRVAGDRFPPVHRKRIGTSVESDSHSRSAIAAETGIDDEISAPQ